MKALLTCLCSLGSECPYNTPAQAGVIGEAPLFTPLSYKDWASTEVNKECFITGRRISPMKFCWMCNVHLTYITSGISSNNMMDQHVIKSPRCIHQTCLLHYDHNPLTFSLDLIKSLFLTFVTFVQLHFSCANPGLCIFFLFCNTEMPWNGINRKIEDALAVLLQSDQT